MLRVPKISSTANDAGWMMALSIRPAHSACQALVESSRQSRGSEVSSRLYGNANADDVLVAFLSDHILKTKCGPLVKRLPRSEARSERRVVTSPSVASTNMCRSRPRRATDKTGWLEGTGCPTAPWAPLAMRAAGCSTRSWPTKELRWSARRRHRCLKRAKVRDLQQDAATVQDLCPR